MVVIGGSVFHTGEETDDCLFLPQIRAAGVQQRTKALAD